MESSGSTDLSETLLTIHGTLLKVVHLMHANKSRTTLVYSVTYEDKLCVLKIIEKASMNTEGKIKHLKEEKAILAQISKEHFPRL